MKSKSFRTPSLPKKDFDRSEMCFLSLSILFLGGGVLCFFPLLSEVSKNLLWSFLTGADPLPSLRKKKSWIRAWYTIEINSHSVIMMKYDIHRILLYISITHGCHYVIHTAYYDYNSDTHMDLTTSYTHQILTTFQTQRDLTTICRHTPIPNTF